MELNLPFTGAYQPARDDVESDPLRPLDWGALVARLGAERDLRRELANTLTAPLAVADFAHGAALLVGGPSHNAPYDAPSVNPDALANSKSTGGNMPTAGRNRTATKLGARGQQ